MGTGGGASYAACLGEGIHYVTVSTMRDNQGINSPVPNSGLAQPERLNGDGSAQVAVLIPCHDEESTVATVVQAFSSELPFAHIYVCDNACTDGTAQRAQARGATVIREPRRGKGHAVRRLFADVDADVYLLVDGDATYDPHSAPAMVAGILEDRLDMVVGTRQAPTHDTEAFRRGHVAGNAAITRAFGAILGGQFTDILSGYRAMSRRFVKSFPIHSNGFDIETELTAHAVEIDAAYLEIATPYGSRGEGSASKLRTYRDGFRILLTLIHLFETMYPLRFFLIAFVMLTALALGLGIPVVQEYSRTGLVLRFPTAILAVSIQIIAFLAFACGVILKSVRHARQEARRLAYLHYPAPLALSLGRKPNQEVFEHSQRSG